MPDKAFKALVIIMLNELEKRIGIYSENFNKQLGNIKTQLEMNNSIAEIKYTLLRNE